MTTVTAVELRRPDVPRPLGIATAPVVGGTLSFVLLTGAVFWYQLQQIRPGDASPRWSDLHWGYLAAAILCVPLETLAAAWRTRLVAGVLHPRLRYWTCLQAEWVNVALNLLTPAHLGGGPGQVYIMGRAGVPPGTALTISLLGFLGTMVALVGMGLYTLAATPTHPGGLLFAGSVGSLGLVAAGMLAAGLWPDGVRACLGCLTRGLWRLAGRSARLEPWWPPTDPRSGPPLDHLPGAAAALADLVLHLPGRRGAIPAAGQAAVRRRVPPQPRVLLRALRLRFLGLQGSSLGDTLARQAALVFLVFFAPTPGGAGLAEAVSLSAMSQVVPAGFAPYYNLLWRFTTAYLPAMAGLFCLALALAQDAQRALRRGAIWSETV